MATRSTIALEYADGTVDQVYCHWDGYLTNNGEILLRHYQDPFKVQQMMELGAISSLKPTIGERHHFSMFEAELTSEEYDSLYGDMTTFYGRDRGEADVGAKRFQNFEDYKENHQYEEYEYILRVDGQWYVSQHGRSYEPLEDALMEQMTMEDQ